MMAEAINTIQYMMRLSWIEASSSVLVVSCTAFVAPESTASNGVDNDDEREDEGVEDGQFLPLFPDVFQHRRLARHAVEAQLRLDVAPRLAVRVRHRRPFLRHRPVGGVVEFKAAVIGWLAATRLHACMNIITGRPGYGWIILYM